MTTQILVQNLKCGGCASTITKQLSLLKDVKNIQVNPQTSMVAFEYDIEKTLFEVEDRLKQLGYPAEGDNNSYFSKAKSYFSCASGKMNS